MSGLTKKQDKLPGKLTQKQENFCLKYVECGNASEAYRHSYSADKMKHETVNRNAHALLDRSKILTRVAELREMHTERHKLTVDDLIAELEENRQAALEAETVQASAATAATMGKAKLLGLDKQLIDHQSSDGSMAMPSRIELVPVSSDNSED